MKVKTGLKKTLALLLTVVLLLTTAPLSGFVGLDLSGVADWFSTMAQAATSGELTYSVENGKATITGHNGEISGELVIPETLGGYPVTSIGNWALNGCFGLTSITIPNSVTSIGDSAFKDCTNLTSVIIPESITNIGGSAFDGTKWYDAQPDDIVYAGKVLYKYKGNMPDNTCIDIPEGVKGIADEAFCGCTELASITIPNSVTSISDAAFRDCVKLTSVTIPESVISIGNSAFSDCKCLTSITIPNGVTNIGAGAFSNCTDLTNIVIPESVIKIGIDAFNNTLWYSNKPNGIVYAGKVLYKYKGDMPQNTQLSILNDTKGIADYAFYRCENLTDIKISNNVEYIGLYSFGNCYNLTSIIIPNGVKTINGSAFSMCSGLKSITIGCGITTIGSFAFNGCTNLTKINWDAENVNDFGEYHHGFSGAGSKNNGIDVVFGDNVKNIPAYLFFSSIGDYIAPKIKSVSIGKNVTEIGSSAFRNCTGLKSVTIPNNVLSIGSFSFGYDNGFNKVKDFTIYGYIGTVAERYATENAFEFVALDKKHAHTFSEWKITIKETCTKSGIRTRICSTCGAVETVIIAAKGHTDENMDGVCDECGRVMNNSFPINRVVTLLKKIIDWIIKLINIIKKTFVLK